MENHHIIPKCLGGSNDKDNLIILSYRDHCFAHLCLYYAYNHKDTQKSMKMAFALNSMVIDKRNDRIINSRFYEKSKILYKKELKEYYNSDAGKKMAKERGAKGAKKRSNSQKFKWYHKEYGTFDLSAYELSEKFNDLNSSNLLKVANGSRNVHKGWVLLLNKELNFDELKRLKMSEAKKGLEPWNKGKTDIYSLETKRKMGIKNVNKGKKMKKTIRTFDIDGVINLDEMGIGLRPTSEDDVIITGRSFEEEEETLKFLRDNGINNKVYFNPLKFSEKTRESSGLHKANVINNLQKDGFTVLFHVEDDLKQIEQIRNNCNVQVIHFNSNGLVELENIKR